MNEDTRTTALEALGRMLDEAEYESKSMARPARRKTYPEEYAFSVAEVARIKDAIADLRAEPTLEIVPSGDHPYPEPHSKEGVRVGPGYIQLVGYGISSTTIRLHPDWRLMRRVDEGTQEASDGS